MKAVMENEGLHVAGFEYVTDDAGNHYCYDINTNTNYNSEAGSPLWQVCNAAACGLSGC